MKKKSELGLFLITTPQKYIRGSYPLIYSGDVFLHTEIL
jgi:hypothetical protein